MAPSSHGAATAVRDTLTNPMLKADPKVAVATVAPGAQPDDDDEPESAEGNMAQAKLTHADEATQAHQVFAWKKP